MMEKEFIAGKQYRVSSDWNVAPFAGGDIVTLLGPYYWDNWWADQVLDGRTFSVQRGNLCGYLNATKLAEMENENEPT